METFLQSIAQTLFNFFNEHYLTMIIGLIILFNIIMFIKNLPEMDNPSVKRKSSKTLLFSILFIVAALIIVGCNSALLSTVK
ncbi:MAG: hypothetical protein L0K95_13175 [Tetragenococcus koreensis]|nr:hypothetical protein [Tetragenococcus koreensis]